MINRHEQSVPAAQRRRQGVHYTPPPVADGVLGLAFDALGRLPARVCDPTCGGGAFLVSVAERLLSAGVPAEEIVRDRLIGRELDDEAVRVARSALSRWAEDHGVRLGVDEVRVHQGDALGTEPSAWPDRPPGGFDLVVGNPPFLSQLSQGTARDAAERVASAGRFGPLGAYTDGAGLFLLAAAELIAPGGVVAMVQPQSLLSARDASAVRSRLLRDAELVGLWACEGTPFPDAAVHVCAPVLRRRAGGTALERGAPDREVRVVWQRGGPDERDHEQDHESTGAAPEGPQSWGPLLAPALGVPDPVLPSSASSHTATVGTVATATAGFRDEFYALCDAMRPDGAAESHPAVAPRLVTVGMVDPVHLRWGSASHRVGGQLVRAPTVEMDALAAASPRVARWARDRLRPKVLVATQTKVVEAVPDPDGSCVPMTPTISVEPHDDGIDVWHLTAALSAPPVAAAAVREHLGTGRTSSALRWSARAVLATPLPIDHESWGRGARLVQRIWELGGITAGVAGEVDRQALLDRHALLDQLGTEMTTAHGLAPDDPVVEWWSNRRPRR